MPSRADTHRLERNPPSSAQMAAKPLVRPSSTALESLSLSPAVQVEVCRGRDAINEFPSSRVPERRWRRLFALLTCAPVTLWPAAAHTHDPADYTLRIGTGLVELAPSLGIIRPCQCTSSGVSVSLWISTVTRLPSLKRRRGPRKLTIVEGSRDDVF